MTVIHNSVVIRCTTELAFDYLTDHRTELEWNPKCEAMEKLSAGPAGKGTRYRAQWRGPPCLEPEAVQFDRPRSWTSHNGGPLEVTLTCSLEQVTEGTELFADFEARPHGWFRLFFPLFLLMARRDEKANMGHLRDALERRANERVED